MVDNRVIERLLIFIAGTGIGASTAYFLLKTKYEKLAESEITEMREYYTRKSINKDKEIEGEEVLEKAETVKVEEKPNLVDYAAKLKETGYNSISTEKKEDEEEYDDEVVGPFVISPEEAGEFYDIIELTYYADGILTNDKDEPIDPKDIDDMIGLGSLNCFGEYEEDSVHVRNHDRQLDYEILRVLDSYGDEED